VKRCLASWLTVGAAYWVCRYMDTAYGVRWVDGYIGWMDILDGRMGGCIGWTDGWMDGRIYWMDD
jgi:hypothetical protein